MSNLLVIWVTFILTSTSVPAHAQTESDFDETPSSGASAPAPGGQALSEEGDNADVESLYDKYDADKTQKAQKQKEEARKPVLKDVNTLSELSTLAPFTDVAVIQRRFLPRTGRFEFTASGLTSINNPFFNNLGGAFRGAYYFTEKHGFELQYMLFSNTRRSVTTALEEDRQVRTSNLVTVKNYMGAAYKWTPWYGKISFLNTRIVPFDLFVTVGGGLSKTEKQNEPTAFLGTGQAFALSKSFAVRWDLVWNFYQAEADSVTGGGTESTNHNDLFLSAGVSFFIPEATYR